MNCRVSKKAGNFLNFLPRRTLVHAVSYGCVIIIANVITLNQALQIDSKQHYYNKKRNINQRNYKINILIGGKKFINAT